jgi:hypothetical protein
VILKIYIDSVIKAPVAKSDTMGKVEKSFLSGRLVLKRGRLTEEKTLFDIRLNYN